jgi:hypothetical protein
VNLVSKLSSYTSADAATFTEKTRAECAELSGRAIDRQLNALIECFTPPESPIIYYHHNASIPPLSLLFFLLSPSILHISPLTPTLTLTSHHITSHHTIPPTTVRACACTYCTALHRVAPRRYSAVSDRGSLLGQGEGRGEHFHEHGLSNQAFR